ncbi:MAG: glycosyltransferase [Verrucomicrobiae bacterium]|nr:glycosyltransferase [Verrucomicrobiae bacterium]
MKRILLITGSHVVSCPRLVKNADALHRAGYEVLALGTQTVPAASRMDAALAGRRPWRIHFLNLEKRGLWLRAYWKAGRLLAGQLIRGGGASAVDFCRATAPWYKWILRELAEFKPDLVLAHTLAGLVPAHLAFQRMGIPFGFDMEDFHAGEREGGLLDPRNRLADDVLRGCLLSARFVFCAAPLIASEAAKTYGLTEPPVLLNGFPLASFPWREERLPAKPGLSLAWFSQTIGMDRGLQDVLVAAALLKGDFTIHLRGSCGEEVRREIETLARLGGFADRCHIHPWCPPDELPAWLARHDVGLALEPRTSVNRDLCISNKILLYPLAGLAVAATRTRGQEWVMQQAPEMGFLYEPGDVAGLTAGLQRWLDDPAALAGAKTAARRAAEERFCWEKEEPRFLKLMETTLAGL